MVSCIAALQDDSRDRGHTTARAVGRLTRFHGGELVGQHQHGRIEVAPVEVAASRVGSTHPLKEFRHGASLKHGECTTRFDGQIDAAVFTKLVTNGSEGVCGIVRWAYSHGGLHWAPHGMNVGCMVAPMPHPEHPNLHVLEHPLIQDKLARIREVGTPPGFFRSLVSEVAGLMVFQISRDLPLRKDRVQTPLEETDVYRLGAPVTIVPILRAGIGLADGVASLMPEARVGHIGLYRDEESLEPVSYYCKLPDDIEKGPVFLVDPMLATGGSAVAAVKVLRSHGCEDVRLVCLVAAPEGVLAMCEADSGVPVFTAALDRELSDIGYILPGLGDAGDRMFGTR